MILDHLNFPMLNPHRKVCKYGPHLIEDKTFNNYIVLKLIYVYYPVYEIICPVKISVMKINGQN